VTRARNGAAAAAPVRPIYWHTLPYEQSDETGRWPNNMLPCADGDELLARVDGEVVTVTVDRTHGCAFRREDGEAVEPDAIATPPRRTFPEADRETVALKVRVTPEQRRRLDWIHREDGHDLSTIVGMHIDQEWDERHWKG